MIVYAAPTSPTATENAMEVYDHDIKRPRSLSNPIFIEEEQISWPHPNNLEEGEDMPDITSVQEFFVTCSPEVEIQASNTIVHKESSSFNSPTVTNVGDAKNLL